MLLNFGSSESMELWMSKHIGVTKDNYGFGREDVLADADAYLLMSRYWRKLENLSTALQQLRSKPKAIRILEFYQARFASSPDNLKKAFRNLLGNWGNTSVPMLGSPLTVAAHSDRLPDASEANRLASIFAICLSRG